MITPILAKWDRDREAWVWGLKQEDFEKVQNGYACVCCLEEFVAWVPVCPVCRTENNVSVAEVPEEWVGR